MLTKIFVPDPIIHFKALLNFSLTVFKIKHCLLVLHACIMNLFVLVLLSDCVHFDLENKIGGRRDGGRASGYPIS